MTDDSTPLFDVIAINHETGERRVIATGKTERNAEAIVDMAAVRNGVETEYFTTEPHTPAAA